MNRELQSRINHTRFSSDGVQVDRNTGEYLSRDGERFTTILNFKRQMGAGLSFLYARRKEFRSIPGKNKGGQPLTLYNVDDMISAIGAGYIDNPGEEFISFYDLATTTDLDYRTLRKELSRLPSALATSKRGQLTQFFKREEALSALNRLLSSPKVNLETQVYRDENGDDWSSLPDLSKQFEFGKIFSSNLAKSVRKIRGRSRSGRVVDLYNVAEFSEKANRVADLPQVSGGVYTAEDGKQYGKSYYVANFLGCSRQAFIERSEGIRTIDVRSSTGGIIKLYDIDGARNVIKENPISKVGSDSEETERDARDFFLENGSLTHPKLREARRFDLINDIDQYPGGIMALRIKLEISHPSDRHNAVISSDQANEQLRRLLEGDKNG